MSRLRRTSMRRMISLCMSLVMALLLTCQGMAMAVTGGNASASEPDDAQMTAMPGCKLMQSMMTSPVTSDSDCLHIVKAVDGGNLSAPVWATAPATLSPWMLPLDPTGNTLPVAALPAHDPVVDPPPTLRLHRFLE